MKFSPSYVLLLLTLSIRPGALVAKDPQFGADLNTPLCIAAGGGDANRVAALLDKGEPIEGRDTGSRTPLMTASIAEMTDVVRLLLARHADPNLLSGEAGCRRWISP